MMVCVTCCMILLVFLLFSRYMPPANWTESGLLSNGHLSKLRTLLLPVKSIGLFKTSCFLPCVPDSMAFLAIKGLSCFFVVSFSSAAKLS